VISNTNKKANQRYQRAMAARTQEEADRIFNDLVESILRANPKLSRADAEMLERSNIGYWSVYYDKETAKRVQELYNVPSPRWLGASQIKSKQSDRIVKETEVA
jgi:hypothetical protein